MAYGTESRTMEIYNFIKAFFSSHGYTPSVREICTGTGLKSTSSVHGYLERLTSAGLLERPDSDGKPIQRYAIKGWKKLAADRTASDSENRILSKIRTVRTLTSEYGQATMSLMDADTALADLMEDNDPAISGQAEEIFKLYDHPENRNAVEGMFEILFGTSFESFLDQAETNLDASLAKKKEENDG